MVNEIAVQLTGRQASLMWYIYMHFLEKEAGQPYDFWGQPTGQLWASYLQSKVF